MEAAVAVEKGVQLGILHVAENPARVIQLSVVQVGKGGQGLGVARGVAGLHHAVFRLVEGPLEAAELAHEHLHVAIGIEQLKAGFGDLFLAGIGVEQPLLLQLGNAQLGRAMGSEQAGPGGDGEILSGLGMLEFIEEDRRDQHGIDGVATALGEDHRAQFLDPPQGVGPEGAELIEALGEQLGQAGLGAVDSEPAIEFRQFGGGEVEGIGPLALAGRSRSGTGIAADALDQTGIGEDDRRPLGPKGSVGSEQDRKGRHDQRNREPAGRT